MSRKILFICNTYYQLIVAMQLALTVFEEDEVDVILSDHSVGAKKVADRLQDTRVFRDVLYLETLKFYASKEGLFRKARDFVDCHVSKRRILEIECGYDEIVSYSISDFEYAVCDTVFAKGETPVFSRMEEGLLSYSVQVEGGFSQRIGNKYRKWKGGFCPGLPSCVFYCFFPELIIDSRLRGISIPPIGLRQERLVAALKHAFSYERFSFDEPFIFFASSSDVDGFPMGETPLVLSLAEELGRENVLVKMHPRDDRTVYEDYGLRVMRGSPIPWEICQICEDLSDRTLLSQTSGALLGANSLIDKPARGFFVQNERSLSEKERHNYREKRLEISDKLERFHSFGICRSVKTASFDEVIEQLGVMR